MAYDHDLADRVRAVIDETPDLSERAMFGGLAFLIGGNMSVTVSARGGLMVRLTPSQAEALLAEDGVEPVEMRGRPMKGWIRVDNGRLADGEALRRWMDLGVAHARTLPAKR